MTTRMISMSFRSEDRDVAREPDASQFTVDLGQTIQRVREVRCGSIELPRNTEYTIETGRNDELRVSEGTRVDVGEASSRVVVDAGPLPADTDMGFAGGAHAPTLFDHQLLVAGRAEDGTYPPRLAAVLTVPPHLAEVSSASPPAVGTELYEHTFRVVGDAPHGLADYQTWSGKSSRPPIVSVAMSTFEDIRFDDPAHCSPAGETGFRLAREVTGRVNMASSRTLLNALVPDRFSAVACGFLHAAAWHAHELCAFLNHALGRRPTAVSGCRFRVFRGRVELLAPEGTRLFFRDERNADGRRTSLGHLLGFCSGASASTVSRAPGPRQAEAEVSVILGGDVPSAASLRIPDGFYDAGRLRDAVVGAYNWGHFPSGAQFGFTDTTGSPHTVVVRPGRYGPEELAAALEYQLDRLDVAGVWASTSQPYGVPFVGDVKYEVKWDEKRGVFSFRCRRLSSAPAVSGEVVSFNSSRGTAARFALSFHAPDVVSVLSGASPQALALAMGFECRSYAGRSSYEGSPVKIPEFPGTLSQGFPNASGVRPLGAVHPGWINGIGSGPATRERLRGELRLAATPRNTLDPSLAARAPRGDRASAGMGSGAELDLVAFHGMVQSATVSDGGRGYRVGDKLFYERVGLPDAVFEVMAVTASGSVQSVRVIYPSKSVTNGSYAVTSVAQGTTRVVAGDTAPCAHHLVVASSDLVEAPAAIPSDSTGWPVPGASRAGARYHRSTTTPLGAQVGDVVRVSDSELCLAVSSPGIVANLVFIVDAEGRCLHVNISGTPGSGYVRGMVVAAKRPDNTSSCLVEITSVSSSGVVNSMRIIEPGRGYLPGTVYSALPVMYYPQNAVVTEILPAGGALYGTVGADTVRASRCPVHAPPGSTGKAGHAARGVVDGSCARIRVSELVRFEAPTNLDVIGPLEAPRLEVLVEGGADPYTFVRPGSAYARLGWGQRDLSGAPAYAAPGQWCLAPTQYVLLRLTDTRDRTNNNVFRHRDTSVSVLAKINIGSGISQTRALLFESGTGSYRDYRKVRVEVLTPDLQPYRFHGKEWSFTINFIQDHDAVRFPCV